MKYAWIDGHRREFELAELCAALSVSASGYRSWKRGGSAARKRLTDAQMLALNRSIERQWKNAYGSPRMVRELRDRGFPAGKAARRTPDARQRHPGAPQAPIQGDHRLEACPAGGAQPA